MSSDSGSRKDPGDTGTVIFGSLFDSESPQTMGSGTSGGASTIGENDLERLAAGLKGTSAGGGGGGAGSSSQKSLYFNDSVSTRKSLRDDDATSVASDDRRTTKGDKLAAGEDDWIDAGTEANFLKAGKDEMQPPAAIANDYLSSWPADKVAALAQHVRAAPWHDVRYSLQTYHNGMTGDEIAQWLQEHNFAKTDEEVQAIGAAMLARGMFYQLNRRSKFRGFATTQKQQYTLEDAFTDDRVSLSSRISRVVKSASEQVTAPFRLVKGNHVVHVYVSERQRRPDPTAPYSSEFLRSGDGSAFSMERSLVPVPAVDDESPDMCEWVDDEWRLEINDDTDADGWRYSIDFKDPTKFLKGDSQNKNFVVRLREWTRPARKRIEKKSERAPVAVVEEVEEVIEKTDAMIEEELKREMLSKAAVSVARVARTGVLDLHVKRGKDLLVARDSFVVVEHGTSFKEKSATCPRAPECHHWNYKVSVPISSDLEGVKLTVFQEGTLGRPKCLGQAELHIEANELSREGSLYLKAVKAEGDDQIQHREDEDLGEVCIAWTFAPSGNTAAKESSIKRCVLRARLEKVSGLTREKKLFGPCGVPVPGKAQEKVRIFFIARYFGEYCEMQCRSPEYKFQPDVAVDWKFSALLLPSAPVLLEYWHSDQAAPLGFVELEFDNTNTEVPLELNIKRFVPEGLPQASSAGGNLGRLNIVVQWVPDMDALEELIANGLDASWSSKAQKDMLAAW